MKLVRYGDPGAERPGLIDAQGVLRDLAGVVRDIDGAALAPASLATLRALDHARLAAVEGRPRLGPCIARPGKFLCIGLNYHDHAEESGLPAPSEPIVFMKATSAISGPFDDVLLPPGSEKLDWEVELGVVIGTTARFVIEGEALAHVAGYCIVNDVSERAWQIERGGQWTKGKSFDTFGPVGPWLVTSEDVPDPQTLALALDVDGTPRQRGHSGRMIFPVAEIVAYLSRFMTLEPGDLIATGTPAGVGLGLKPPSYLRAGQTMRLAVEGLGEQVQRVRAIG